MTSQLNILTFCSECMHVFYNLQSDKNCPICHNEIKINDVVSNLQILSCETCHTLYTTQDSEEIIPKGLSNPNQLCACHHNCPTNSLLGIGEQEAYIGNIVLVDIYICSNCDAISFRNFENNNKYCNECGSRFINPVNWDSEKEKIFFKCANPTHKIRLKLRDLILFNNKKIKNEIKEIKLKERNLQDQYYKYTDELKSKFQNLNVIDKIKNFRSGKENYEDEMTKLNKWAKIERISLYSQINPKSMRCAVYSMVNSQNGIKFLKTNNGCEALANITIKKIIIAPDGTVIEREINNVSNVKQFEILETNETQQNKSLEIFEDNITKSNISQLLFNKISDFDSIYSQLPKLKENQFYVKIIIKSKNNYSELYQNLNYGILPLYFVQNSDNIKFGKEYFLNSFWQNPLFFKENPFIFFNITRSLNDTYHFLIKLNQGEICLEPGKNVLSKTNFLDKEGKLLELKQEIQLKLIERVILESFCDINKEHDGEFHHLFFDLEFNLGGL